MLGNSRFTRSQMRVSVEVWKSKIEASFDSTTDGPSKSRKLHFRVANFYKTFFAGIQEKEPNIKGISTRIKISYGQHRVLMDI